MLDRNPSTGSRRSGTPILTTGIIDVHYADLVSDPLRTVETIYSACGRELDDQARDAVMACIAANPKGQFGTHGIPTRELRA